jgi:hypothetical protein
MRHGNDRTDSDPSRDETRRRGSGHRGKLSATFGALRRGDPALAVLGRSSAGADLRPLAARHAATGPFAAGKQERAGTVRNQKKNEKKPGDGFP